jgi:hypothetical protein
LSDGIIEFAIKVESVQGDAGVNEGSNSNAWNIRLLVDSHQLISVSAMDSSKEHSMKSMVIGRPSVEVKFWYDFKTHILLSAYSIYIPRFGNASFVLFHTNRR